MKAIKLLTLFLVLSCRVAAQPSAAQAALLAELNLARTSPAAYALILEDYLLLLRNNTEIIPAVSSWSLIEGKPAVLEAIAFLRKQKPLLPLTFSPSLSFVTDAFLAEQAAAGTTGHVSLDGSTFDRRISAFGTWTSLCGEALAYGPVTARLVVIAFIVDDNIPDRGHRTTLFTPAYRVVGITIGAYPVYGTASFLNFAGGYTPHKLVKK